MKIDKMVLKSITIVLKVVFAIVVVMVVYKASMLAYDYGYRIFAEPPVDSAPGIDVEVYIDESMDTKAIGKHLESEGLLRDGNLFYLQNVLSKYKDKLLPGNYVLNTSMTNEEMMEVLSGAEQDGE